MKFPWGVYTLWNKEKFIGRFSSAEEAKQHATRSDQDSRNNPQGLADKATQRKTE